jgi:Mycothiol maleylpyruvate isomerase N-terminal domain
MSRTAETGSVGLAALPYAEQRDRVLTAWDDFVDLAEATDLTRPSRLPGWTGHDVCVHVGDWPGVVTLDRLIAQATGRAAPRPATDAANAQVVAEHRDASRADVLAALVRSRDKLDAWFDDPAAPEGPDAVGRTVTDSAVGPLPLLTVVAASAYELAVHALDLGPCGAPAPGQGLLEGGLAALVDVTGVFAARRGIDTALTAWTGEYGWQVTVTGSGWTTRRVTTRPDGAAVEAEPAVLLDASAGRRAVPPLLAARAMRVHGVPELLKLAPIVEEVPGLPGGPALAVAGRWVGGAGRLLRFGRDR